MTPSSVGSWHLIYMQVAASILQDTAIGKKYASEKVSLMNGATYWIYVKTKFVIDVPFSQAF